MDLKILILDTMMFNGFAMFFDWIGVGTNVTVIALLFYFIYQFFLKKIRSDMGEENISEKTMIDERFLI